MAKVNGTQVITNPVRLSYVHIFEPYSFNGSEPKYSVALLIPKSDKDTLDCIKKAQKQAYENAKGDKLKGLKFEQVKTTLKNGDEDFDTDESPEYKNMVTINVSCKTPPGIVDQYRQDIVTSSEVYSGCWARVDINFYAYNTAGNRGISAGLNNIQKIKNDAPLGGRARAEDVFDDWEDEDDDDIL